jgi:hypothetical protein
VIISCQKQVIHNTAKTVIITAPNIRFFRNKKKEYIFFFNLLGAPTAKEQYMQQNVALSLSLTN